MFQCLWLLLTGRRGGGVWGKCRDECNWNEGRATLNMYCILFINARTKKIACILLTLSTYIPDKCLLLTKVKVMIELAFFFFFPFPLLMSHKSLLDFNLAGSVK